MNYRSIRYILGWVICINAGMMVLPCIVALVYGESEGLVFLGCGLVSALAGVLMTRRNPDGSGIFAKEGFVIVALSWVVISIIGALPFWLSGAIPSFTDSLFEIVSGFTTTGASILNEIESLPYCVLFWRSMSHWIGGMGVLVFMLAILPLVSGSHMHIMKAESPGPSVGKLVPRVGKTAKILYYMYFALTVAELILLLIGGMPLFDALCTTFGTAGTGGFGVRNDSIASYSVYLQVVVTIFMFLFGVNFAFYYLLINKRWRDAINMEEVRAYATIFIVATVLITINVAMTQGDVLISLKDAAFSVSSIMTTTGFATTDFNLWPTFSKILLVLLMFSGACAGSTGGGIKISRILIYIKQARIEILQSIHTRSVYSLKMEGKTVQKKTLQSANAFLIIYVLIFITSMAIVSIDDFGFTTTFTSVAATINNIGPGLDMVGPCGNYEQFSVLSKYVLILDMLIGRLEIFPLLLLFTPATWKK